MRICARRVALTASIAAVGMLVSGAAAAPADHTVRELLTTGPQEGVCPERVSAPEFEWIRCQPRLIGLSGDGSQLFFFTNEALVPEDTNGVTDIYERANGRTIWVSSGPTGSGAVDVQCCGRHAAAFMRGGSVFFDTTSALVPQDGDGSGVDWYMHDGEELRLLTTGPNGEEAGEVWGPSPSPDGTHVFFHVANSLLPEDTDATPDLYEWDGNTLRLVPSGGSVVFSGDGKRVFLLIRRDPADTHSFTDVYEYRDGNATLLSTVEVPGYIWADRVTRDGSRIFFTTWDSLLPEDTDADACFLEDEQFQYSCPDVYEVSTNTGEVRLISAEGRCPNHYSGCTAELVDISTDGERVIFTTGEALVAEDANAGQDIYESSGGRITLVSQDPAGVADGWVHTGVPILVSDDGKHVVWSTRRSLVPGDDATGNSFDFDDLYERFDGVTRLVSTGPADKGGCCGGFRVTALGISDDGRRIFFSTSAPLVPEDTGPVEPYYGGHSDLYERVDGETTMLISAGPVDRFRYAGWFEASEDGSRVMFASGLPLLPEDTDRRIDFYLATTGSPPDCSPATAAPLRLDGPKHAFVPIAISGVTDPDGDAVTIRIDAVTQDEPLTGPSDKSSPDARHTGERVELRAERRPKGDGRVYRIAFTASDAAGGSCSGTVTVGVPRHKGGEAVDSTPPSYESFGG